MKVYGIDVSHHQGGIDWGRTAAELRRVNGGQNPGFVIIRLGFSNRNGLGGLVRDDLFDENVRGCQENGIPFGAYYYCYDRSVDAAQATARDVAGALRGLQLGYPVIYDMEYEPFNTGKDGSDRTMAQVSATNTAMLRNAMLILQNAGYFAGIYASRDFFLRFTILSMLTRFTLWEAAYTMIDTPVVQNDMWQYSSSNALQIAGFGNSLDCDVAYRDFPTIIRNAGLNGFPKP